MTLSSRHRIRNSSPGGLRPSTLPLGHGGSPQYWLSHVDGEETFFVSFKPPRPGTEPRTLAWKAAVLTTTLGPPPNCPGEPPEHTETQDSKYNPPSRLSTISIFTGGENILFVSLRPEYSGRTPDPKMNIWHTSQQTQDIQSMLFQCWASIEVIVRPEKHWVTSAL